MHESDYATTAGLFDYTTKAELFSTRRGKSRRRPPDTTGLLARRRPFVSQSRTFHRSSWRARTWKSTNRGTRAFESVLCTRAQTFLWREGPLRSDDDALTQQDRSLQQTVSAEGR